MIKLLKKLYKKGRSHWRSTPFVGYWRSRLKNFDEVFFLITGGLLCGFLIGGIFAYAEKNAPDGRYRPAFHFISTIQRSFAPVVSVPGAQENQEFLLADFESAENFSIFEVVNANLEPEQEHARSGGHSARLRFFDDARMTGIRITDYFDSRYAEYDWSHYRSFDFYAYNPQNETLRFVLQLKDGRERRYNFRIELAGLGGKDIVLPLAEAAREIDLHSIRQVSLFIWENRHEHDLFLDDLRLKGKMRKI